MRLLSAKFSIEPLISAPFSLAIFMKFNESQALIFRKLLGVALFALALLGASSLFMKEVPLALFGEHATGTVKKVEVIQTSTASKWVRSGSGGQRAESRGGFSTLMYIDFSTNAGKAVQIITTATFHTEAKVGDKHPMIYLSSNPENAKLYSAKQLWLPMCVGFSFVGVCSFLGLRLLRSKSAASSKKLN